jgi:Terminase large subunit, T4likevirus-type, N-terminal
MMARDLSRAFDPVLLARDLGIEPDDWQAKLLRDRPKRALLLCARQVGKTEAAVILTEHVSLYEPGSLCLIVSPSQRQSGEVFRRLMLAHSKLKDVPELVAESALRAEYANGSRVLALPGTERTVRGYAGARLVVLDEAARIDDELMAALRPMLATVDGSLIMLSTPAGKRGVFFTAWTEGEGWTRVRIPASECPRLSKEFLAEERRELGDLMYRQEYQLEFVDDTEALFTTDLIARAFCPEVVPLWR